MRVVATAGHVDHGKSTLVLALTGTDPDRFPEEKARGLTIDLGFAFTRIADDVVGFVDVPGHVRFIKNMLAGVGAVEVALLVIAANEGWMPQTDEHARILELLGVRHGLVVLTKADLVDADTTELALLELEERLSGRVMSTWPVVIADAVSGWGVDAVRATLESVLAGAPIAADRGRPRLWVDRSFATKGAGTVVTGTLGGGALAVDDDVLIEPGHRRARIRGIESHHVRFDRIGPGARVALNLAGVEHTAVARGDAVVLPDQWNAVAAFDGALTMVPGEAPLQRGFLRAHVGSGVVSVHARVLTDNRFVRVRLRSGALPLAPGDRLVLRSTARGTTVAGAEVLDVVPTRRASDAPARLPLPLAERVLAARPWVQPDDIVAIGGVDRDAAVSMLARLVESGAARRAGPWTVAIGALDQLVERAGTLLDAHLAARPLAPGIDLAALASQLGFEAPRVRAVLEGDSAFVIDHETVRRTGDDRTAADDPAVQQLLTSMNGSPFTPPQPSASGVDADAVRALVREGRLVVVDGLYFTADALEEARARVAAAVLTRGSLKLSDIRDLLGSTRKFVVPLAARLDAEGVTRRRGDDRIAGPRATAYSSGG